MSAGIIALQCLLSVSWAVGATGTDAKAHHTLAPQSEFPGEDHVSEDEDSSSVLTRRDLLKIGATGTAVLLGAGVWVHTQSTTAVITEEERQKFLQVKSILGEEFSNFNHTLSDRLRFSEYARRTFSRLYPLLKGQRELKGFQPLVPEAMEEFFFVRLPAYLQRHGMFFAVRKIAYYGGPGYQESMDYVEVGMYPIVGPVSQKEVQLGSVQIPIAEMTLQYADPPPIGWISSIYDLPLPKGGNSAAYGSVADRRIVYFTQRLINVEAWHIWDLGRAQQKALREGGSIFIMSTDPVDWVAMNKVEGAADANLRNHFLLLQYGSDIKTLPEERFIAKASARQMNSLRIGEAMAIHDARMYKELGFMPAVEVRLLIMLRGVLMRLIYADNPYEVLSNVLDWRVPDHTAKSYYEIGGSVQAGLDYPFALQRGLRTLLESDPTKIPVPSLAAFVRKAQKLPSGLNGEDTAIHVWLKTLQMTPAQLTAFARWYLDRTNRYLEILKRRKMSFPLRDIPLFVPTKIPLPVVPIGPSLPTTPTTPMPHVGQWIIPFTFSQPAENIMRTIRAAGTLEAAA